MAYIRPTATSSGEKSATAQIISLGGYLHGFELNPPATGLSTLKIYDSNNGSTDKLITTATCAAGLNSIYVEFPTLRTTNLGIYAVLTGAATTYVIGFSLG